MENQNGTVDRMVDQLAEPPGDAADARVDAGSGGGRSSPVQSASGRERRR